MFPKDPEEEKLAKKRRQLFKIAKATKSVNQMSLGNIGMLLSKDKNVANIVKVGDQIAPALQKMTSKESLGKPNSL